MSRLTRQWQSRRAVRRGRRDLQKAIAQAGTPGMRAELMAIAARDQHLR